MSAARLTDLAGPELARPRRGIVPRMISQIVHGFEPRSLATWLSGGVLTEVENAGFEVRQHRELARGTAQLVTAR
jgi:hypothetical protein